MNSAAKALLALVAELRLDAFTHSEKIEEYLRLAKAIERSAARPEIPTQAARHG